MQTPKSIHDVMMITGAAASGAIGTGKDSVDIMVSVAFYVSPDVHVTWGSVFQVVAIGIGLAGAFFRFRDWKREYKAKAVKNVD